MADVPSRWDLTISDGSTTKGYVLYSGWTGGDSANAPQKAIHSYSPTFVPRTNVQGNYGDDAEDFFMTFSQKDWSLGEGQKFSRATDETTTRRYWVGTAVDVNTPGEVSLSPAVVSADTGTQVISGGHGRNSTVRVIGADNLYRINLDGTVTDHGAHGLTGDPASRHAICGDSSVTYFTDGDSGDVRKYDGSFASFSTDGATALCYLNNTLFGTGAGTLYRWSSAGTRSTIHTWLDADGGTFAPATEAFRLIPIAFGGKLAIMVPSHDGYSPGNLWLYDGSGVSKLFDYPPEFAAYSLAVSNGVLFTGGAVKENVDYRPAVYYYANGSTGRLWVSENLGTASDNYFASVCPWRDGILISDPIGDKIMHYSSSRGGVASVAAYTSGTSESLISCSLFAVLTATDDVVFQFPDNDTFVTTGTITSPLIDFDSSLNKLFRGIKIDYEEGSDGDGGSVDISYRVDDVDGAYTSLQTGAVSGTEYALGTPGAEITGRSISYRITLNKGTSTRGPVLKRVYVRAAPQVVQRHRGLYHIDCTAPESGQVATSDHTGQAIPRSGKDMVMELREFADAGSLLTIHDPLHEYTGVIELLEITQVASNDDPGYVVSLGVREV